MKSLNLFILLLALNYAKGGQDSLLLRNANIIDVTSGKVIKGQDLLIINDKIHQITVTGKLKCSKVVSCANKFIIPGLWDMHYHSWWNLHFVNWNLKYGVTGLRNMFTPPAQLFPYRDSVNSKLINGPVIKAAGLIVDGPKPSFKIWRVLDKEEKIDSIILGHKNDKADFIKVYDAIPRELYFKLMQRAKQENIIVAGHVPVKVTATEASDAGQKSIEHMFALPELCSSHTINDTLYKDHWIKTIKNNTYQSLLNQQKHECVAGFKTLSKNKTFLCPTLVIHRSLSFPDINHQQDSANYPLPKEIFDYWRPYIATFKKLPDSTKKNMQKTFELYKSIIKDAYDNGVPLLAGTDYPNPYVFPGISLHHELELLCEAGIPTKEVLKIACLNPALYFNLEKSYGTVSSGKIANLVILNQNPLVNIKNTQDIHGTILNGKLIQTSEINLSSEINYH